MPRCRCCTNQVKLWGRTEDNRAVRVRVNPGIGSTIGPEEREIELTPADARRLAEELLESAALCDVVQDGFTPAR